jgi:hypothetical protein
VVDVTPPEQDCSASLHEIETLLSSWSDREGEVAVLPLDDSALWLCNRLRGRTTAVFAGPGPDAVEVALDKWRQVQLARRAGLNVLPTTLGSTEADVFKEAQEFPLVLRSANATRLQNGRLHKGRYWLCADAAELVEAVKQWGGASPVMVQPLVRGTGEGVFGFATEEGVAAWSAHRRLRMMNPHGSGSSACVSKEVTDDLKRPIGTLIRQVRWRGLFMVELLRGMDGTPWFIELNGRTWGSLALSRRQGFEYAAWAVRQALYSNAAAFPPLQQVLPLTCRNLGREFMHFLFVLRGPKSSAAAASWPGRLKTLGELSRIGQRVSLYNWRRDDKQVLLYDSWYTVKANVFKERH